MATLATLSKSSYGIAQKVRQTSESPLPLSLRKIRHGLKSGASCPVSQTSSILRWHSRSKARLDGTRLRAINVNLEQRRRMIAGPPFFQRK